MVEQAKQGNNTFDSALIKEIYADPNQYEFDANSIVGTLDLLNPKKAWMSILKKCLNIWVNMKPNKKSRHYCQFKENQNKKKTL